jgi:hypothetical protein
MKIRLTFFTIACITAFSLKTKSWGPIPVTPAENAFFSYLDKVSKISFSDNIPLDPWVECDDQRDKSTFFSASLNQFMDPNHPDSGLQTWLTSFLDHAYWARVSSATCLYEANHFNECFARGSFRVTFRSKRVIGFKEIRADRYCNTPISSKN